MARTTPLRSLHLEAEASLVPYGPASHEAGTVELVETFGELEMEYAALRKHCVLLDQPHRAVIEITGRDRLEFLNRMITQELKGMGPFRVKRSFWLNRKGRIDADLRVIDLPSRTLLDADVHAASRAVAGLSAFVVSEDVQIADRTEQHHRLALHGPSAMGLIQALAQTSTGADASGPSLDELGRDRAAVIRLGGAQAVIFREDSAGEVGLELVLPVDAVEVVYHLLVEAGRDPDADGPESAPTAWAALARRIKLRPAGWHAYNIARIEAGTPLYNIDFGPESTPAETGVLDDRVSFTKGCYLGQEIVARMHSRGHSKQSLVGVKFESTPDPGTGHARQPVTGTKLHTPGNPDAPVGAVASSTLSPMLGGVPVCFAQVKPGSEAPGALLECAAAGGMIRGTVQPSLAFWRRDRGSKAD